mgnify:CR=1 FL=1
MMTTLQPLTRSKSPCACFTAPSGATALTTTAPAPADASATLLVMTDRGVYVRSSAHALRDLVRARPTHPLALVGDALPTLAAEAHAAVLAIPAQNGGATAWFADGVAMRTWSWIAWQYGLDYQCYYAMDEAWRGWDETTGRQRVNRNCEIWDHPRTRRWAVSTCITSTFGTSTSAGVARCRRACRTVKMVTRAGASTRLCICGTIWA